MDYSKYDGHTEGPWAMRRTHLASRDCWYVIVDSNGRGPIMDVGGPPNKDVEGQIAEAKYLVTEPREIEANALLIADAPKLLARCKELEEQVSQLVTAFKDARSGMKFHDEYWDKTWRLVEELDK